MRSNEVIAVTDREHVLLRPGMYVGSVDLEQFDRWVFDEETGKIVHREMKFVPGLLKMFDEIVSNSIDEAIRTNFKYANQIDVKIDGSAISVADNGRGIPLNPAKGHTISQAELALTQLRSGANFGAEDFVSIGTHGLGASLVNILSTKFEAEILHEGKQGILTSSDNMSKSEFKIKSGSAKKHGTFIRFVPDFSRFGCDILTDDLLALIHKRVIDLSVCFPNIKFSFNGKPVKNKSFKNYVELFTDNFIIHETETAKLAIFPLEEPAQISFVNGIDTYEGGTHVDFVRNQVVSALWESLNKKYKKLGLKGSDIRAKMGMILICNDIAKPKFRSQTKEYITNPPAELSKVLSGFDNPLFIKRLVGNQNLIDPIIETKKLKLQVQENLENKKLQKGLKKIPVPSHIPANGDPNETILYITEGESATGTFTEVRDSNLHGAYPLRGRPLNTFGMSENKILKNAEMYELTAILGLSFSSGRNSQLNYNHIRIMADADHDGHAIVSSMLAFFSRWPWLFEQGRIQVVRCPIMIAKKKNHQAIRIYDFQKYQELLKSGKLDDTWHIDYFKGLGSLSKEEYESMIRTPVLDVIQFDPKKDAAKLDVAFGPDSDKRKQWLMS